MIALADLFPPDLLDEMLVGGYVRRQTHPTLPLCILNYTEKAAYEQVWNEVTRQCRGLICEESAPCRVVARPFPKFFNHGEPSAPELDLHAPVVVTDKLDGSLGILYPTFARGKRSLEPPAFLGRAAAIATRGSFASEQALHASALLQERYGGWISDTDATYLFEIVYPENRIVVDYGEADDLFLLAVLDTATGLPVEESVRSRWPGPRAETHPYATLAEALQAEPRTDAEGLVVYFPGLNERVKIKQDDYVALHRILTGTNARHVWEFAAVRACRDLVHAPNHWASYLGVDPARAAQLLEVGDGWLEAAGIPDEFYAWLRGTIDEAEEKAGQMIVSCLKVAERASLIADRRDRYGYVLDRVGPLVKETMRIASGGGLGDLDQLTLRAWREAAPEPTAPFARTEDVA